MTKKELEEAKEETREILMDIKDDVLNTRTNTEEETLVNKQQAVIEKPILEQEKIKELKKY